MAIKEVTLSQDIENETGRYNEKTGWVRLYFNTDNGYIWAEDTNDCPKANHTTYDMNKNIVTIILLSKYTIHDRINVYVCYANACLCFEFNTSCYKCQCININFDIIVDYV